MLETFDTIYYTSLFLLGGYISQQIVENAYPSGDDAPSAKNASPLSVLQSCDIHHVIPGNSVSGFRILGNYKT